MSLVKFPFCCLFIVVIVLFSLLLLLVVSLVYFVCLCYSLKASDPLPLLNVANSLAGADRYSIKALSLEQATLCPIPYPLHPNQGVLVLMYKELVRLQVSIPT